METLNHKLTKKWVRSVKVRAQFNEIEETDSWYNIMEGSRTLLSVGKNEDVVACFHGGIRLEAELTESRIKRIRIELKGLREEGEINWIDETDK